MVSLPYLEKWNDGCEFVQVLRTARGAFSVDYPLIRVPLVPSAEEQPVETELYVPTVSPPVGKSKVLTETSSPTIVKPPPPPPLSSEQPSPIIDKKSSVVDTKIKVMLIGD